MLKIARTPADAVEPAHHVTDDMIAILPPCGGTMASCKGLAEALSVGYLGERLALLPSPAADLRRIAERENSQYVQIIRDA